MRIHAGFQAFFSVVYACRRCRRTQGLQRLTKIGESNGCFKVESLRDGATLFDTIHLCPSLSQINYNDKDKCNTVRLKSNENSIGNVFLY